MSCLRLSFLFLFTLWFAVRLRENLLRNKAQAQAQAQHPFPSKGQPEFSSVKPRARARAGGRDPVQRVSSRTDNNNKLQQSKERPSPKRPVSPWIAAARKIIAPLPPQLGMQDQGLFTLDLQSVVS
ncbi:hypothetical protein DFP73DRAFT_529205 [Morchella snyderi]|nr:hypothetical protein DFP73DRAFT_529205 [Morchella snyderi]